MISVAEAEQIILSTAKSYSTEQVALLNATGRVLAEDIVADRGFPPFNRVTMDGIAILFKAFDAGTKTFTIRATQAAGGATIDIADRSDCIEIMTGAALPSSVDTVIRYEDLTIEDGKATINIDNIKQGQNVHLRGKDKHAGEILVKAGEIITPAFINTAATVGKTTIAVKSLPGVVVLSNGDELVDIDETPSAQQIRRSNSYATAAILKQHGIVADMQHLPDDEAAIATALQKCLEQYDVLILSGGVSMGKYDYLPKAFEQLGIEHKFHKVKQRPGKPFWFGLSKNKQPVFAFPGNPVSTFMCMHRYFIPWLHKCLGMKAPQPIYAALTEDYTFAPALQYFLQVKLNFSSEGRLMATPGEGNGSGDFVNLLYTDAFMELPEEQTNFKQGESFRIWPYKQLM